LLKSERNYEYSGDLVNTINQCEENLPLSCQKEVKQGQSYTTSCPEPSDNSETSIKKEVMKLSSQLNGNKPRLQSDQNQGLHLNSMNHTKGVQNCS
jgi:hypothetical protein